MIFDDLRLHEIVFYGIYSSGQRKIQGSHPFAVSGQNLCLEGNFARKLLPYPLLFHVYIGVYLLHFADVVIYLLRRLELHGNAHVILIHHFQLFYVLYLFKIRMGFSHDDVKLGSQLNSVFFSQFFSGLLLLFSYEKLILTLLASVFS